MSCSRFVRTVTRVRVRKLDAVLGDGAERGFAAAPGVRTIDDLGVHAGTNCIEDVTAGQIDGGRTIKVEVDPRALGRDDGVDHAHHVAAGQVVRFETRRRDSRSTIHIQTGLPSHHLGIHDDAGVDLAKAHADQAGQGYIRVGHVGSQPEVAIDHHHDQQDEAETDDEDRKDN